MTTPEQAAVIVEKLEPKSGDVIVIQTDPEIASEFAERVAEHLNQMYAGEPPKISVLVVPLGNSVCIMDEEEKLKLIEALDRDRPLYMLTKHERETLRDILEESDENQ